jgi:hypothetical protein
MVEAENLIYLKKEDGEWDWEIVRNDFLLRLEHEEKFPCNRCLIKVICSKKSNCPFRVDFIRNKVDEWRLKEHEEYIREMKAMGRISRGKGSSQKRGQRSKHVSSF